MAWHHPNTTEFPEWVVDVGNNHFHKCLTIVQRMNPTPENLTVIRGLIDSLEYEYLDKRRILDVQEGIGSDSTAVKKALEKRDAEERG